MTDLPVINRLTEYVVTLTLTVSGLYGPYTVTREYPVSAKSRDLAIVFAAHAATCEYSDPFAITDIANVTAYEMR